MAMVGVVSGSLYRRTHSLSRLAWSWVGGRLAPFYIHQMNRVNSELSQWLCHDDSTINIVVLIIIIIIIMWKVLENPDVYRRKRRLDAAEREKCDAEVFARLSRCPGKLDHATAVAYEVGRYRGNLDDDYCVH